MNKIKNKNNGITLIALVITIIVMLILVSVTITMAVNGGLFNYAQKAVGETKNAINKEQELANLEANMTTEELINKYMGVEPKEYIGTEKSYVGYYADFDGVEGVDGIIYADLAFEKIGQWVNGTYDGDYIINKKDGLKNYYISQTSYNTKAFKQNPVLKAEGAGEERFFVMALEDFTSSVERWYVNAPYNSNTVVVTSPDFGKGMENTVTMIEKWKNSVFGAKDDGDLWGKIQTQVEKGWFLPSKAEWSAFGDAFDIDKSNYNNQYELTRNSPYWTSSQIDTVYAYVIQFNSNNISWDRLNNYGRVRLSATF